MIVRNKISKDFTTVRNAPLNDKALSLKAKGLWAFLMTKPDKWQVSVRGLETQLSEGKEAIMGALRELEAAGLYQKIEQRDALGHFSYQDFVYDKPCTENPHTGNPYTENTQQVNTNEVNTDIVKTEKGLLPSEASSLALKLAELVNGNQKMKITDAMLGSWAKSIDRLHRIDGFDYQTIDTVIQWSQQDEFWHKNIRSGSTLRKQFDRLLMGVKTHKNRIEVIS